MTEKIRVIASRWETPFESLDRGKLHLLRVTYPSCSFIQHVNGAHYDFSEYSGDDYCEIVVFSETDQTVYRILSDADTVRIHDERDLELVDEWASETGRSTMRLTGTHLHRTVSSAMNQDEPTYLVVTGMDCVEFICLNDPIIEAIGKIEDSRPALH